MAEFKHQHFLAQSYLREFSTDKNSKTPTIWVANIEKKEIKLKSIKNTAERSYLYSFKFQDDTYDHRMEHYFSNLEREYPIVIDRIREGVTDILSNGSAKSLPARDRMVLSDYLFMNLARVPKVLDWMVSESDKHNQVMRDKGFEDTIESSSSNLTVMGLHSIWTGEGRKEALEILTKKNTIISFTTRRNPPVLTCDNPVIRYNPHGKNGIVHDDTQVLFPLFSRAYLTLHRYGDTLAFEQIHDMSLVNEFNEVVAKSAFREIYGSDPQTILECLQDRSEWTIKEPAKR